MALTREERAAGRWFRDMETALLADLMESDPPTYVVPSVLAIYRHLCSRRRNNSTALELREIYRHSPPIAVRGELEPLSGEWEGDHGHRRTVFTARVLGEGEEPSDSEVLVPAGRFGFITKAGKCACGQTARSREGNIVDAYERPPLARSSSE